jgi:hypothetical protein
MSDIGIRSGGLRSNDSMSASRSLRSRLPSARTLLIAACGVHLLLVVGFVLLHHMWWEQDETVYLSQVASHSPALDFTPPRARGMPVLLFPVVHFTTRLAVVRSYLAVIGTLAMYAGFRPWLRLGLGRVVPAAALVFSALWTATFFGAEAQPNFLVAMLSLASAGYVILATRQPARRRLLVAVVVWVALLALVRPSDATWLAAALAFGVLASKAPVLQQRATVLVALVGGLVVGWGEWVVEAYVSYGGFLNRIHEANADNTPGVHFSLITQASAVNGPTLCRPCDRAVSVPHVLWWFAIPPLITIGLVAARRTRRFVPLVFATAAGTALLLEYVVTISYAAPRFLLPAYALFALPCAAGVAAILTWRPRWVARAPAIALVVGLVVAQVVSQTRFVHLAVDRYAAHRQRYVVEADKLRLAGVRAPCVINGVFGTPVAFALHCNDHPNVPQGVLSRVSDGTTVVEVSDLGAGNDAYPGSYPLRLFRHGPRRNLVAYIYFGGSQG